MLSNPKNPTLYPNIPWTYNANKTLHNKVRLKLKLIAPEHNKILENACVADSKIANTGA